MQLTGDSNVPAMRDHERRAGIVDAPADSTNAATAAAEKGE
ncbi:MAG: hypothetical protein ACRC1H_11115 [Caldilineaceae bacterium]